jgi:hypothetical protein
VIVKVAGTRALLDPPAGLGTLVPGELPPLDPCGGCALTPPELDVLVLVLVLVVFVAGALVVVLVLGAVGAVGVPVEVVVLAAAELGELAVLEARPSCVEPPQPAIASAAINAPENRVK